jgi:uncharacterized membrane protein
MTSHRILVALLFLWCAAIAITPLLSSLGGFPSEAAGVSYQFFSHVCHQFDSCSFHYDGYKFPVCIRCMSIYGSFFTGILCLPFFRRLKRNGNDLMRWLFAPSHTTWLLAVAVAPMVLDVCLSLFGIHTSNVWTRLSTGIVFGMIASIVLGPLFEEAIRKLSVYPFIHRRLKTYAPKTK